MNTDLELLELAAKAYGLDGYVWSDEYLCFVKPAGFSADGDFSAAVFTWHPLISDGDALKLAAKLRIEIRFNENIIRAITYSEGKVLEVAEISTETGYAGLRRVIVVAAAEIGRKMP